MNHLHPLQHAWMTDEIAMLRDQSRRFIEQRLVPQLPRWRAQKFVERSAWAEVGAMGMLLPELPEAFGGSGATLAHQLVLQEEFARAEVPGSSLVHCLVAHYLLDFGTAEQQLRWLPRMVSGDLFAAIAMTEPGAARTCRRSPPTRSATAITTSSTARRPSSPTAPRRT